MKLLEAEEFSSIKGLTTLLKSLGWTALDSVEAIQEQI